MDISIGIITWNARALLEQLLDSILATVSEVGFEIVLVDNGSSDGTVEMVRSRYPQVVLVENAENRGVAPARNQLLKKARGRYILSVDVDTTFIQKGAVETLVATMDSHPRAAIGGPKLVYKNGALQLSCRPFPSPLNILIEGTSLKKVLPDSRFVKGYTLEDWDHAELREVDWMYGAALVIRSEALERIGFLDEGFFYLYEDIDLCFQARRHGYQVLYIPEAVICHHLEREERPIFSKTLRVHLRSIGRYLLKDYSRLVGLKAIGKWPQ
jgi:N-acetylglucosaminyl-diphospho-decaprenol L-rhamnosyltransferase